jgi:hypothetical protein
MRRRLKPENKCRVPIRWMLERVLGIIQIDEGKSVKEREKLVLVSFCFEVKGRNSS